jgi:hypothetical protein
MTDVTLAAFITDITSVITLLMTVIHDVLQLIMTSPVLEVFVAAGVCVIAVKVGFRILAKTKRLAN